MVSQDLNPTLSSMAESQGSQKFKIKKSTAVSTNRLMELHECGWSKTHGECPDRLRRATDRCADLFPKCLLLDCEVDEVKNHILACHSEAYVTKIEDACKLGSESDGEAVQRELCKSYDSVFINSSSYSAALLAAGGCINILDAISEKRVLNGMALVRPPGHHAMKTQACGFSLFNNVAIAARYAVNELGFQRVMIVDWDVHHGQGTQYEFYDDPRVLYCSIHRYMYGGFWPHLRESDFDHIGTGRGCGYNVNIPVNATSGDSEYMAFFHEIIMPIGYQFNPDLVLVSAGFDAALGDPLGEMAVTPPAFAHFTHMLKGLARGAVAVVLEGGYCLDSLEESVYWTLKSLLGESIPRLKLELPNAKAVTTIESCIAALQPYWSCFQPGLYTKQKTAVSSAETLNRLRRKSFANYDEENQEYSLSVPALHSQSEADKYSRIIKVMVDQAKATPNHPNRIYCDLTSEGVTLEMQGVTSLFDLDLSILSKLDHLHLGTDEQPNTVSSSDMSFSQVVKSVLQGELRSGLVIRDIRATDAPSDTAGVPSDTTGVPSDTTGVPSDTTGVPSDTTGVPSDTIGVPSDSTGAPSASTGVLPDTQSFRDSMTSTQPISLPQQDGSNCKILVVCLGTRLAKHFTDLFYDSDVLCISINESDESPTVLTEPFLRMNLTGTEGPTKHCDIAWNRGGSRVITIGDAEWVALIHHIVLPMGYQFDPDLVVISDGFCCSTTKESSPSVAFHGMLIHSLKGLANGRLVLAMEKAAGETPREPVLDKCMNTLMYGCPSGKLDLKPLSQGAATIIGKVMEDYPPQTKGLPGIFQYSVPSNIDLATD